MALLCAFTGVRAGELFALRWRHLDFERGVLQVPKPFILGWSVAAKATTGQSIEKAAVSPTPRLFADDRSAQTFRQVKLM
ncbi:MAG: hypothetical protein WBC04_10310 [Candidatus Acidiferrales bacterium]